MAAQDDQQVRLHMDLDTSPPHTFSVSDMEPSEPLRLIARVKQTASPFPDRPVTILTKYSCLDDDAFWQTTMSSPEYVGTRFTSDEERPTTILPMCPPAWRIRRIRVGGGPDLLQRDPADGHTFITIPPVGRGHSEVEWELSPQNLMKYKGTKNQTLREKMDKWLRVGDEFRIKPRVLGIDWWSFGSLDGEDGWRAYGKKVARWSLPDDMPLVREEGADETEEVAKSLQDWVDRHDVNRLDLQSAEENEQIPDIGAMRREGWVFGEPRVRLTMSADKEKGATFSIVE